jgi:hypothetical protein
MEKLYLVEETPCNVLDYTLTLSLDDEKYPSHNFCHTIQRQSSQSGNPHQPGKKHNTEIVSVII